MTCSFAMRGSRKSFLRRWLDRNTRFRASQTPRASRAGFARVTAGLKPRRGPRGGDRGGGRVLSPPVCKTNFFGGRAGRGGGGLGGGGPGGARGRVGPLS